MSYSQDLTDILNDTVEGMAFPITIDSVVLNPDGTQTIYCCDIYHAQKGFSVVISGNTYTITDFSQADESLTLSGTGTINPGVNFNLYTPFFFHGTPLATTEEINKEPDAFNKTPMIWLWEDFEENITSWEDPTDRDVTIELYFLTQAQPELWQTQDAYNEAIKPMRRLLELFIEALKLDTKTYDTSDLTYKVSNWAKFGVYARGKGSTKNIMVDKLSGVSAKIPLGIFKRNSCPCP